MDMSKYEGPPPPPPNQEGVYYGWGETEASKQKHKEWEIYMAEWRLYHTLKYGN